MKAANRVRGSLFSVAELEAVHVGVLELEPKSTRLIRDPVGSQN